MNPVKVPESNVRLWGRSACLANRNKNKILCTDKHFFFFFWREDKPINQFLLFVKEVCCFPHSLMRERSKSHAAGSVSQPVSCSYKCSLTIGQHVHKYLWALKSILASLNSPEDSSVSHCLWYVKHMLKVSYLG